MRIRRLILGLTAVLVLAVAGATAAFAAPRSQEAPPEPGDAAQAHGQAGALYGMALVPMNPRLAEELDLPEDLNGLVVMRVAENGAAGHAGIEPKDVIAVVLGSEAGTTRELLQALIQAEPGDTLTLIIVRDHERQEVLLQVPERPTRPDQPDRPDRPDNQAPAWLKQTYQFANQHPHALDVAFRNVDDDGGVHVSTGTNGRLIAMGVVLADGTEAGIDTALTVADATPFIVVEMLNGETKRFRLGPDSVIVEEFERTRLGELELGERVIVAERDGRVLGVVAGPFKRDREQAPHPTPAPGDPSGIREVLERIDHRFDQVEHGMRQMKQRIERLEQHVSTDDSAAA